MHANQKIISFSQLSKRFDSPLERVVLVHGVFDLLHAGHLAYFREAKCHGDILVVTLTSDRYVNKGPGRPYFNDRVRAEMLAALDVVDYVCISDHPTATPAILELKPDVYVKGPDYKDKSKDITGEIYNEERAVKAHGGSLVFTESETHSSSNLLNRFFMNWSDDQLKVIDKVKALGGESYIHSLLEKLERERVTIIGEPIMDIYRFCIPEGISSKSPSISARFQYEERYYGGSWAIQNHLRDFVESTFVVYPETMKVPEKVRYISLDKAQRIFEVTDTAADNWVNPTKLDLREAKRSDVCILADFGHRLFEGEILERLKEIRAFTGLNVQTNSSNYGFNLFRKHKRFDLLSLDTREARLSCSDRSSDPLTLAQRLKNELQGKHLAVTLGANGAWLFSGGRDSYSPAFSDVVIDATGAGDAFFSLATVLTKVGADPVANLFLSNVFAGLKTKIIGNKSPVSKASLVKAVSSILK